MRKMSYVAPHRIAMWLATGLGLGLVAPAPGTFGTAVWGLPFAWAVAQIPGFAAQLCVIVAALVFGVPLCTAAGRALGGETDNQAIIWDEIATTPVVFLLVPLTNWRIALAGFLLHRAMDITKPPPARQLEALPEGLGVMADDVMAAIYGCILLTCLAWAARHFGFRLLST
jgi:phosphatidylglycerophosphatase A